MVDGIRVAEHTCVVALGVTIDGTKVPLALAEGATENAPVVTDLLTGLRERGLEVTRPILVVDGAKALRRGDRRVRLPRDPTLPAPQRQRPSRMPPDHPSGRHQSSTASGTTFS
jgi:hypothetical protein